MVVCDYPTGDNCLITEDDVIMTCHFVSKIGVWEPQEMEMGRYRDTRLKYRDTI